MGRQRRASTAPAVLSAPSREEASDAKEDNAAEVLEAAAQAAARRAWLAHKDAAVRARDAVAAARDAPRLTFASVARLASECAESVPAPVRRVCAGHVAAFLYPVLFQDEELENAGRRLCLRAEALQDTWSDAIVAAWGDFPAPLAARWRGADRPVYSMAAEELAKIEHPEPYAGLRAVLRTVRVLRRHVAANSSPGDITHAVVGAVVLTLFVATPPQLAGHLGYVRAMCSGWKRELPALLPTSWSAETQGATLSVPLALLVVEAAVDLLLGIDGAALRAPPGSRSLHHHWRGFSAATSSWSAGRTDISKA